MSKERALLDGKVAMITGASSGIGAAAARLFAQEGAAVVLMARRKERLDTLVEEIRDDGGRALAVAGDVASSDDVAQVVRAAVDTFGKLDAAFNNAGYATAGTPLHEIDDATYDRTLDVNLRGVWNCLRHQIPVMLRSPTGGAVVNTSSVAGTKATGASAAYVAAKHAVIGLTRAAALDYGQRGVRCNALVVGSTRTEMMDGVLAATPELEEVFMADSVQRRISAPVEVAQAAAWLCSDRASFITGAAMAVDGGSTAV
ncbi:short-chain dehydrogenase [Streptomyces populi]|uniref:Short-chain dehydrogenase n=1 Tax=Streptomyces populi TaxID=2058924 RepID=A0A2I0SC15_9ACTN|nr:glucose 1-dehydrogenase [Streptomyces populi]PKT67454.1 short-chain dehydrogenase [Streptomyces populi]